ncbi:MAG: histone deacetylase [Candidatus Omnitrophica bacterium]|nr:histone deacetylase [Candidatus Omnitrophota bacterium]
MNGLSKRRIIYSPRYAVDIGAHVFPTRKYSGVKDLLLKHRAAGEDDFLEPVSASEEDARLAHTGEYVKKLKNGALSYQEILTLELPFSPQLVEASFLCAGGTIDAARLAIKTGAGIHMGGGFHHAFPDHGEGFCVLNDIAIGIRKSQLDGLIKKAIVVDCDLHQGNGTAEIFKGDRNVFTFSIHQRDNYPFDKPESSLDINLENGVGDEEYIRELKKNLPQIFEEFRPELMMYVAGADPYEKDMLGGLSLTIDGLKKRDEYVLGLARDNGVAAVVVFGGGYAGNVDDTIEIHYNTVLTCLKLWQ